MEPLQTRLKDRDGNEVSYLITPIRPSQSIDLALNILACIAKPGSRLIKLGLEAKGLDNLDDEVQLKEFLAQIDFTQFGADAESVLRSLAARPDLVRRLFDGTIRDNQDMSNDAQFDLAYMGNWGELYAALKVIVEHNGLLPFLDSLSS